MTAPAIRDWSSTHGLRILFIILLVAYISFSDGVDYIHGFGKACLVVHEGWHMHMQCGSVRPPAIPQ